MFFLAAIPALVSGFMGAINGPVANAAAGEAAGDAYFQAYYNAAKNAENVKAANEKTRKAIPYAIGGIVILALLLLYLAKRK